MGWLADGKSAKELDFLSQESGMDGMILMERAALSIAEKVRTMLDEKKDYSKVIAVCGTGNNGGDGLCAARILSEWNYEAAAIIIGNEKQLSLQMKKQVKLAEACGTSFSFVDIEGAASVIKRFREGIIIDAVFGVGLTREVSEDLCGIFSEMNYSASFNENFILSVDLPSGISADDGKRMGVSAVKADLTVTFGVNKLGLMLYPGKDYAGEVFVADIGFPRKIVEAVDFPAFTNVPEESSLKLPKRLGYGNKGTFGKVLIIAGSYGMSGAAYLSALAAFRNGAGMVKIFTHESNRIILQTLLPEAIMETYSDDEGSLSPLSKEIIKNNLENWADVVVVGSGIGKSKRSRFILEEVLKYRMPTVIDADAITLFKEYIKETKKVGSVMEAEIPDNIILTPHVKELSDLLELGIEEVKRDFIKLGLTWKRMKDKRGVLVMKDAVTLVTGGDMLYVNSTGNSSMAKAGSGDVLTGYIAAFLALGKSPFYASHLGVFFHGLKGDKVRDEQGIHTLLARDLT